MSGDLEELYKEVILDHNRHPRNFREMLDATRTVEGYNPLCGDMLRLYLKLDGGPHRGCQLPGPGLRHLGRLGLPAHRTTQGLYGR